LPLRERLLVDLEHRVSQAAQQVDGELGSCVSKPLVMVARPNQDLPAAGACLDLAHRHLRGLVLARIDAVERIGPKGYAADSVVVLGRGLVAVAAVRSLDRKCLDGEGAVLERAVGDDRRPPAGDRVAPELEPARIVPEPQSWVVAASRRGSANQSSRSRDIANASAKSPCLKMARRMVPSVVIPAFR